PRTSKLTTCNAVMESPACAPPIGLKVLALLSRASLQDVPGGGTARNRAGGVASQTRTWSKLQSGDSLQTFRRRRLRKVCLDCFWTWPLHRRSISLLSANAYKSIDPVDPFDGRRCPGPVGSHARIRPRSQTRR